jgi:hypothetical protein
MGGGVAGGGLFATLLEACLCAAARRVKLEKEMSAGLLPAASRTGRRFFFPFRLPSLSSLSPSFSHCGVFAGRYSGALLPWGSCPGHVVSTVT